MGGATQCRGARREGEEDAHDSTRDAQGVAGCQEPIARLAFPGRKERTMRGCVRALGGDSLSRLVAMGGIWFKELLVEMGAQTRNSRFPCCWDCIGGGGVASIEWMEFVWCESADVLVRVLG